MTIPLALVVVYLLAACTPFGSARSAQVRPGVNLNGLVSLASSPGDITGRLLGNDYECSINCGGSILGTELGLAYGLRTSSTHPIELGIGATGNFIPFADGFVQLGHGSHPYGIGARMGGTGNGSTYRSPYGRYDAPMRPGRRLLWNPALTRYATSSKLDVGRALAFSNTLGLEYRGRDGSVTPALAVVLARATKGGAGPVLTGFVALALNFELDFGAER